MHIQCRTHPAGSEGTVHPDAITYRGCAATGEKDCDVLSGPHLVPNQSSAHFGISKFPQMLSLQLRKASRNIPVNHQGTSVNLLTLVSGEGWEREGGMGGGPRGRSWGGGFSSWAGIILSPPGTSSLTFRPDPGILLQSLTL